MIRLKKDGDMISLLYKPVCIALLLLGLFGLVWLRSHAVSVAYGLRDLEEQKMGALKEKKSLLAERAKLMSLSNIDPALRNPSRGDRKYASADFVFPDRVKVIHVKRNKGPETYRASLDVGRRN